MRHVIFDIGGVLINYDFERLARALAAKTGADEGRLTPLFGLAVVRDVETGRVGPEDFFARKMSPVLPGLSYEGWVAAWADNYSVNEPGWELLEDARDLGHTVSLLSNLSPYNQAAIKGRWPHFFRTPHHSFYSYDLGFHKPEPDIYRAACAALQAEPADCLFLDDLAGNVEGAQAIGLRAIEFTNDRIPEIRAALGLSPRAPEPPRT